MVRLRATAVATGRAPVELRDAEHDLWTSASRTLSFLENLGIDSDGSLADMGAFERHRYAVRLWALSVGNVAPVGRGSLDWTALRAAGIPASNGAVMVEKLIRQSDFYG